MDGQLSAGSRKIECRNEEDVKKLVKELNISFIQFWFVDVLGFLKSFAITPSELDARA